MATQSQIFEVRKLVRDPFGFTDIVSVADESSRPAIPIAQNLYYIVSLTEYQAYQDSAWVTQELVIADSRISTLYDLYLDANKVAAKLCDDFVLYYGKQIGLLSRTANGTETDEYRTLKDIYQFYKDLKASFIETANEESGNDTGKYVYVTQAPVGGMIW